MGHAPKSVALRGELRCVEEHVGHDGGGWGVRAERVCPNDGQSHGSQNHDADNIDAEFIYRDLLFFLLRTKEDECSYQGVWRNVLWGWTER